MKNMKKMLLFLAISSNLLGASEKPFTVVYFGNSEKHDLTPEDKSMRVESIYNLCTNRNVLVIKFMDLPGTFCVHTKNYKFIPTHNSPKAPDILKAWITQVQVENPKRFPYEAYPEFE